MTEDYTRKKRVHLKIRCEPDGTWWIRDKNNFTSPIREFQSTDEAIKHVTERMDSPYELTDSPPSG